MSKEVKIALFNKNTPKSKVIKNVGDFVLDNICVSCSTKEDLTNGNYELDAKFIIDNDGVWRNIEEESILKVKMDYGYEIFKVVKPRKDNKYITVFARQITIQNQLAIQLSDVRPTNSNGYSALDSMIKNSNEYLEGRQYARDLEFSSDINKTSTAYYVEKKLYQALFDCDQSFMNRWGGEIQRRGYLTTINTRIGQDRGFQVRYGKNLTGFESETTIDSVITRIKPKAYNGHTIEGYVQSGNINKYATVKTIEIKYDNVKLVEDCQEGEAGFKTLEELRAELIRLATLEFTEKHVDELQASYRVNFIDLFKTEEYKKYSILERVYLGDVVNVYMDKLDINISVRAITKRYDVMKQRTIEIELSNIDLGKFKPPTIATIKKELDKLPDNFENILNQAKDFATDLINAGINGYVVVNKNEILIMDTPDKNTATKLWRMNLNGIAHSSNGYNGQFNTAWTMDGKIVLSEITCEGINALLITSGVLRNRSGSVEINLEGQGVEFKENGRKAIDIIGRNIKFYDWDGEGESIGQIYSSRMNNDANKPGIVLANRLMSYLSLAYESNGQFYPYIRFDNDNIDETTKTPITIYRDTELTKQLWFGFDINSIYKSTTNHLVASTLNDFLVADRTDSKVRFKVNRDYMAAFDDGYCYFEAGKSKVNNKRYFTFKDENGAYFYRTADLNKIWCLDDFMINKSLHVNGDFSVSGTKNCIQSTQNYGDRLFYSVEDCESYLTDRSMDLFTVEETPEGTFERVILLDNIFKEAVRADSNYTIEVVKQGWGDYRIKEQNKDYFIVESDRKDFTFKYVVTAKRRGFEDERLKEYYKHEKDIDINVATATENIQESIEI